MALNGCKSGVYLIECTANGKFYVGSSKNLRHRLKEHINTLNKQKHHNPHLQCAWNRYGADAFKFSVLMGSPTPIPRDIRVDMEQMWIMAYSSHYGWKGLFNIAPYANAPVATGTPESYRRGVESRQKYYNDPEWQATRNEAVTAGIREYYKDPAVRAKAADKIKRCWQNPETRAKKSGINHYEAKPWPVITPDGIPMTILDLPAYCKENNIEGSAIRMVVNGTRKHHKGYTAFDPDIRAKWDYSKMQIRRPRNACSLRAN